MKPHTGFRLQGCRWVVALVLALALALPNLAFAAPGPPPPGPAMRWVDAPSGREHLDTAIWHYARGKQKVDLIGAVHVADRKYYWLLTALFTKYDRLLFELVKPEELDVRSMGPSDGKLSSVQRWLKDRLHLEFQLDNIDYGARNFVHADIDSARLGAQLLAQAGNLIASLLAFSITDSARLTHADGSPRLGGIELAWALAARDQGQALKRYLGRELSEVDLGSDEFGGLGFGSVLIRERNQLAVQVLQRELAKGRRSLAIFYGAAHLPDLHKRLVALGFAPTGQAWLVAWQLLPAK
ncbi:MAG: hypothetical protein HY902_20355 [Deltaproteobacteria bacterium]|nr:hypothetical protein [Deltaproteobacteria bacterium]